LKLFNIFSNKKDHFKTSIVIDLEKIITLLTPSVDPSNYPSFYSFRSNNTINFREQPYGMPDVQSNIPLNSLRKLRSYSSFIVWEADLDEYISVYKTKLLLFLEDNIPPIVKLIKENSSNIYYKSTLINYEITMTTIITTIEDSYKVNGTLDDEITKKILKLLKSFEEDINYCRYEHYYSLERDNQAINKSLLERLEREEEYIDKFVKYNI
jgi:hypothetical protein